MYTELTLLFSQLYTFGVQAVALCSGLVDDFFNWSIDLGITEISFMSIFLSGFFIYAGVQLVIWLGDIVT